MDVEQGRYTLARFWEMNQNLPENKFKQMISQPDKLRKEGEHMKQQQNGSDSEPTFILQENGSQPNVNNNNNNNNRGQWIKCTKQLNIDIIRWYFCEYQINPTEETFILDGQLYIQRTH